MTEADDDRAIGWPEVLTAIPANARDPRRIAAIPDVPDGLYDGLPEDQIDPVESQHGGPPW